MTEQWIEKCLDLAVEVSEFLSKIGYDLTLSYGTLLGAVRDGDIIKGDDDLDFSIILNSDNPREEIIQLIFALKSKGYLSKVFTVGGQLYEDLITHENISLPTGQIHIKGDGVVIDLWCDWVMNGDYINGCFGNFGEASRFLTPQKRSLRDRELLIPNNAEKMLQLIYGDWQVPRHGEKRGRGLSPRRNYLYFNSNSMKIAKVQAIKRYTDVQKGELIEKDVSFEVSVDRATALVNAGVARVLEVYEKPKAAPRKNEKKAPKKKNVKKK